MLLKHNKYEKKHFIFFSYIFLFACNGKNVHIEEVELSVDHEIRVEMPSVDSTLITISDPFYRISQDKEELDNWKMEVRDNGSEYYYNLLVSYYDEQPKLSDELVELIEIMITRHNDKSEYRLDYYCTVSKNEVKNKKVIMKKAINYLEQIIQMEGAKSFHSVQARNELSDIYRKGIYVKQDTILANYLESGGCNLDSIKHARNFK